MPGVEILAMEKVVAEYAWNWEAYFITIFITVLLCALAGFVCGSPLTKTQDTVAGMIVGFMLGAAIGCLPAGLTLPSKYETHYKVIISDEVSMNDFLERYEILSQEGKIYTVRERNGDNND